MAVTQNTYTGNGSTVLYSFTFPYLDPSHIKIEINGTLTTAYTLANATTVQFNSAPADGAAIRIYRQTGTSQLQSTFFPGSSIRSQDLNDNFQQSLYVAQETENFAAATDASSVLSTANSALSTANTANTTANTASSVANGIAGTANTALSNSNTAVSTANSALNTVNLAVFPSGTVLLFQQTAAPTGWTKLTTHNNKALRVVSGNVGSGGTTAFTSVFTSRTPSGSVSTSGTVGATTLSTAQIPSHNHQSPYMLNVGATGGQNNREGAGVNANLANAYNGNLVTAASGGGGSHDHSVTATSSFTGSSMDFDVQYVDVIFASKN